MTNIGLNERYTDGKNILLTDGSISNFLSKDVIVRMSDFKKQ
jgi:hypothetical protein